MSLPEISALRLRATGQVVEIDWSAVFALQPPSPRVLDHRPASQRFTIQYREGAEPDERSTADALLRAISSDGLRHFPARLRELAAQCGIQSPPRVRIGLTRSRWASRSGRGTIACSLMLLFLPPALCDHVLIHELCHVRHMDHGPEFHALLRSLDPQADAHSAALRTATRDYIPRWLRIAAGERA